MPSYREDDPLLPRTRNSPEISGSRPSSISDVYEFKELRGEEEDDVSERRRFNDSMAMVVALCLLVSVIFIFFPLDSPTDPRPIPSTIEERVERILTDTPLIDGHNDLAIFIRARFNNHIYEKNFTHPFEEGGMAAHVDLPRLAEGQNGGAFWSAFVPCPKNASDFSDLNYADSVAFTLTQLDVLSRLQQKYPTKFSSPPNSSTALKAFQSGQLISPLAIEGLHQIGNSISNLRLFHSLGVRYATLTHNCHNIYADAALLEVPGGVEIAKPYWHGVSPAGRDLVFEMNRLGVIVDLAHVSQDTMRAVLGASDEWEGSAAPIIFSHSSAYALCPHPRNVPDDILELVKEKNSVVMVNFSPDFVSCVANASRPTGSQFDPENNTLEHVVSHIIHIGELIGYDHVGLGSDFDGIPSTPRGLDDVSKFPDLVAELLRRGVSDEDASKIIGGNVLRVWEDVDNIALKLQSSGARPVEDALPGLWGV